MYCISEDDLFDAHKQMRAATHFKAIFYFMVSFIIGGCRNGDLDCV